MMQEEPGKNTDGRVNAHKPAHPGYERQGEFSA